MTPKEKALYPSDPPGSSSRPIALSSVVSLYFLWQHQLVIALALHFLPPIIASGLLIRFGKIEPLRDSALGRYVGRNMTRVHRRRYGCSAIS